MKIEEISPTMVGQSFNGLFVTRVTDGTLATVGEMTYRYKFPKKGGGFLADEEENVIIRDFDTEQLTGVDINGIHYGTELIGVFPRGFDEKLWKEKRIKRNDELHVWWHQDFTAVEEVMDRHPLTQNPIAIRVKRVGGTKHVGTYQEFVDAVNAAEPKLETPKEPEPVWPKAKGKK